MKYDSQYYLLGEDADSGRYMINKTRQSDKGLRLLRQRSVRRNVVGKGHTTVVMGDKSQFSPCDYHEVLPAGLISDKFKIVLEGFNLPGVDFYEADIENNGKIWDERHLVHIWQNYPALHQGRSKIKGTYVDNDFILKSMSLDENLLDKVPLEDRLVFRLNEKPEYLYHESVVAAIKAAGLTGVRFIKVSSWGVGSAFELQEEEDAFYDDL